MKLRSDLPGFESPHGVSTERLWMAYQEQTPYHTRRCLRRWTMRTINYPNIYPKMEACTTGHTAPQHNWKQTAAQRNQEVASFHCYSSNVLAKVPVPRRGSAHPNPVQAKECLHAGHHWLSWDSIVECQCHGGALMLVHPSPNFVEKKQEHGTQSPKHHGWNRNLWELSVIFVGWQVVWAEENE